MLNSWPPETLFKIKIKWRTDLKFHLCLLPFPFFLLCPTFPVFSPSSKPFFQQPLTPCCRICSWVTGIFGQEVSQYGSKPLPSLRQNPEGLECVVLWETACVRPWLPAPSCPPQKNNNNKRWRRHLKCPGFLSSNLEEKWSFTKRKSWIDIEINKFCFFSVHVYSEVLKITFHN